MSAEPPPSPPGKRFPWPFDKLRNRRIIIIGGIAAIAIAAVVFAVTAQQESTTTSEFAPDVKFVTFQADKQVVKVGESTTVLLNVQNSEGRAIDDARVIVTVEPAAGNSYLSISNNTVELPDMNPDARTGEIRIKITATGTPAEEAVYSVKGTVVAEDARADVRELQMTIKQ